MRTAERVPELRRPGPVRCECGFLVFDGQALRSRVVLPGKGVAKCRCKRWVEVPVRLIA